MQQECVSTTQEGQDGLGELEREELRKEVMQAVSGSTGLVEELCSRRMNGQGSKPWADMG